MPAKVYVSEKLRESVERFLCENNIQLELVADSQSADISIVAPADENDKKMCDPKVLRAGGWIKCPTVWAMGKQHGLNLMQLGALLNMLDIRIRECALGCFE